MSRTIIFEKVAENALKNPEKIAIRTIDGQLATYADVKAICLSAEEFLSTSDIDNRVRIALISTHSLSLALLALPIIENAVLVPLDPAYSVELYQNYLKLFKVDYVMTDEKNHPAIIAAKALGLGMLEFAVTGPLGSMSCKFSLGFKPETAGQVYERRDDIAVVSMTSGTTSDPKVVPISYTNLISYIHASSAYFDFDENTVQLILVRLHRSAPVFILIRNLFTCGSVYLSEGFNHAEITRVLNTEPITTFSISPAQLNSYMDFLRENAIALNPQCLQNIQVVGAPLPQRIKDYFEEEWHIPVIYNYGMTEVFYISSSYRAEKGFKIGSSGTSVGLDIRIEEGEILVRGSTVFPGYETDTGDEKAYFVEDWFKTGDAGFIDEDGYVFISGRIKELINRGGEKISPYIIEEVILGIGGIKNVAAFPYPNGYGSDDVGVAIVAQNDDRLSLNHLRMKLAGKLLPYQMPTLLYMLPDIPVGPQNKVRRNDLFSQIRQGYPDIQPEIMNVESGINRREGKAHEKEILTKTQRKLRKIWQKLLKSKGIGLDDNFFHCGGDSLLAAHLFSIIEEDFRIQASLAIFSDCVTMREQASKIDIQLETQRQLAFLNPIRLVNGGKPIFFFHMGEGEILCYLRIAEGLENYSVYGLKFNRSAKKWQHPITFEQMAEAYIHEMRLVQPKGPYRLGGYCYGGRLAYEAAVQLLAEGEEVAYIAMIEPLIQDKTNRGTVKPRQPLSLIWGGRIRRFMSLMNKQTGRHRQKLGVIYKEKLAEYAAQRVDAMRMKIPYSSVKKIKAGRNSFLRIVGNKAILAQVYLNHKEKPCDAPILYFKPGAYKEKSEHSLVYWQSYASKLIVLPIEGMHQYEDFNQNAAAMIEAILELEKGLDIN